MLLVSVSALESNTASKDTINDSASVVVCLFRLRPNLAEDDRSWLMEEQTGTDLAPQKAPTSLFSLFFRACVLRACDREQRKGKKSLVLGKNQVAQPTGNQEDCTVALPRMPCEPEVVLDPEPLQCSGCKCLPGSEKLPWTPRRTIIASPGIRAPWA